MLYFWTLKKNCAPKPRTTTSFPLALAVLQLTDMGSTKQRNFTSPVGVADMQTVKYFNLVGDEEDIGNERFKWSRASTFSYNRNAIGLVVAYATAIRTHLSVLAPLTP